MKIFESIIEKSMAQTDRAIAQSVELMDMCNKLRAERDAWRQFALHVEICVTCGMTTVGDCMEGSRLRSVALKLNEHQ